MEGINNNNNNNNNQGGAKKMKISIDRISTDFQCLDQDPYWTPEQYMWAGVLERMIVDILHPDLLAKEYLAKTNNAYSLDYALFVDDPTIGTAFWIAEQIFEDDAWYDKLTELRGRVKTRSKAILPITINSKE